MKLKRIGVVLVGVLAVFALSASAASAAQFKSNSSPVMTFGQDSGNHVFKVDGQAVACNSAVFEKASLATPANTVPGITAAYSNCTMFGFAGATVNFGNCTIEILTPNATLNANVALRCGASPVTANVSVFGSECSVSIGESGNTNLSGVSDANNNPSAGKVLVTANISGITVKKNKDNGLCPLSGAGTVTNGTYTGPTPVEGTSGVGISVA